MRTCLSDSLLVYLVTALLVVLAVGARYEALVLLLLLGWCLELDREALFLALRGGAGCESDSVHGASVCKGSNTIKFIRISRILTLT